MIQFKNENIVVFESAIFRTTSSVILTNDMVLVVDPNWLPGEITTIAQFVEFAKGERPVYLLFTHSDYDHIIGWRAFPGAKVIASEKFSKNPDKQEVVEQIFTWDEENYVRRNYPVAYPEVDIVVSSEGQVLPIGDSKMTFYLAPGHTSDGIFTIFEDANWNPTAALWIAGDYLSNVEFPFIYHNSHEYENTLSKTGTILSCHPIRLLVPGHGDVAIEQKDIFQRQQESLEYIHTLRYSLSRNLEYDTSKLWQRYSFRRGMQEFHDENIQLIRKELSQESLDANTIWQL